MSRRTGARAVLFGALLRCVSERTEVLVTVDTDLSWGRDGAIRSLTIEVRPGGVLGVAPTPTVWPAPTSGAPLRLPMTFTLSPRDQDDAQVVWVEVNGCPGVEGCGAGGATPVVTERAIVTYLPHRPAKMLMFLAGACQGVVCREEETCSPVSRSCVSARRVVAGGGADAGLDARDDLAAGDVGEDGGDAIEEEAPGEDAAAEDVAPVEEPCPEGLVRCGGGCVSLDSVEHCGVCGGRCEGGGAHTVVRCEAGRCRVGCEGTWLDCDGLPATGCEVDVSSDRAHCGRCRNPCTGDGGETACAGGTCTVRSCAPGRGDCDARGDNGCEVDLTSSGFHCGMCNLRCDPRNAQPVCREGRCDYGLCDRGFGDCDGDRANGCEQSLTVDVRHCGACGRGCSGLHATTARCNAGVCESVTCEAGWADCNGRADDGCESELATSVAACGACGTRCAPTGASAVACVSGRCELTCMPGRADCDGSASNGCEVDVRVNLSHCGRCGNGCMGQVQNAQSVGCSAGECRAYNCLAGYADCDGSRANGCETNVTTDANCGSCGTRCRGGRACAGGRCACMAAELTCPMPGDIPSCGATYSVCCTAAFPFFCDALGATCWSGPVNCASVRLCSAGRYAGMRRACSLGDPGCDPCPP